TLGYGHRLLQAVDALPVEIVARHRKKGLSLAVRIDDFRHDVLAAQVHVRHEANNLCIVECESAGRLALVIAITWWNVDHRVGDRKRADLAFGGLLGENDAD